MRASIPFFTFVILAVSLPVYSAPISGLERRAGNRFVAGLLGQEFGTTDPTSDSPVPSLTPDDDNVDDSASDDGLERRAGNRFVAGLLGQGFDDSTSDSPDDDNVDDSSPDAGLERRAGNRFVAGLLGQEATTGPTEGSPVPLTDEENEETGPPDNGTVDDPAVEDPADDIEHATRSLRGPLRESLGKHL
jgi:hypothetical protein